MSNSHRNPGSFSSSVPRAGAILVGVLALIAALGLYAASVASAVSWETVKTFAPLKIPAPNPPTWDEDVQLGGASGMAVNLTGEGGVKPGTIYTVGSSNSEDRKSVV